MQNVKTSTVRIPNDLWDFMKNLAFKQEKSINSIICECIELFKNKHEKNKKNA